MIHYCKMVSSLCVTTQWSLLSSAETLGSPSIEDDEDLFHLHTSLGMVSQVVDRRLVDEIEFEANGICSIFKIGKTLGQ